MRRLKTWWGLGSLISLVVLTCGWPNPTLPAELSVRSKPARMVTRYALTSTHDFWFHDPSAWRLLGSNDDGQSWTLLDVRTNQQFGSRSLRRVFRVANPAPFSLYRLEVDRVLWQEQERMESDKSVQLADIEFMGPVLGVATEAELEPTITASEPHLPVGPAENAFDNDSSTRWLDFGLAHGGRTWIQCRYGGGSGKLLTNLNQVEIAARIAAAREPWLEQGPRILSNLTVYAKQPFQALNAYALTSANDSPGRDPADWRLLGSNNEGKSWTVLDQRRGEVFSDRFQRRVFTLTNQTAYACYRLEILTTRQPGSMIQLGDVEPLPWKKGKAGLSLAVSAKTDNPPMESVEMAFDGDPKTKWLSFEAVTTNQPNWIQWQFLPAEEELPLVNLNRLQHWAEQQRAARLLERTSKPERALTGYALTSANDWPGRDPRDWRLWGSRDEGRTWDLLDARQDEQFPQRLQRRVFSLVRPVTYPLYRLQIDSVAQPGVVNSVQLAELEPLSAVADTNRSLTLLTSAQGENPPRESIEMLFDHDPATKWLDFAPETNRSSWVEWQYAGSEGAAAEVINLDRLRSARPRPPSRMELRIEAVVVSWDAVSNCVGLIDSTGFQLFELGHVTAVQPGQRVRLSGQLLLGRGLPQIPEPELVVLGPLPRAVRLETVTPTRSEIAAFSGSVQGRASTVSPGSSYSTIQLTSESESDHWRVRVLGVTHLPLPSPPDCRLRVRGVIEAEFNDQGQRVPSTLWAPGLEAVELAPPSEQEWNQWPEQSIPSLSETDTPWARLVHVRGTVVRQQPGEWLVLAQGTNELRVFSPEQSPLPAGTRVEVAGFFLKEGRQPVLRMAQYRQAPERPASAPSTNTALAPTEQIITQWPQLRQRVKAHPDEVCSVRLRGTITYIDLGLADFYLQNGSEAIQCNGQFNAGLSPFLRQEGSYVELEGTVQENTLYPTAFARVLGKGQWPKPLRHSWDYLMSGKDDGLWVEVEGVVSVVEKQRLTLRVPGGQLVVWVNDLDRTTQRALLGSLVRASGVCSPVFNSRRQRLGLRLLVPTSECLELVNAAPEDPFQLPTLPIGRVMQNEPDSAELPTQLVKTTGVVTHKQAHLLFIQDGSDGLRVSPLQDPKVQPGDQVEVVGLPEPDGFSPKLTQAVVRKLGWAPLPAALPINLLDVDVAGDQEQRDATRSQLEATLTAVHTGDNLAVLELRHEKTRKAFSAFLPATATALPTLLAGSHLRLQGVFKARRDAVPDVDQPVTSFEMYLNTPADITVLSRPSWWTAQHTAWVLGGLGTVLLLVLAWVGSLRNQVRQRTHELHEEIEDRKRAQAQLEAEIAERERMQLQVEKTHKELIAASRQAGMAEVATSVLHNVGNVLNSVNISASLLEQKIKKSRAPNLLKAAAMVREHEGELGDFLTRDPKGRQLPTYLVQVAEHLANEQIESHREVQELTRNIEHIKDIVAMQQSYAKVSGLAERVQIPDLVDDALRMNLGALQRHDVKVVRDFAPDLAEVIVDKHKVLQILVNLIRNAKYACDDSGRSDKCLTLRVRQSESRVLIAVIDNGVGIPAENLTRIFNYGFTTRKNGHGFGLHSGALAAKEMGGTLQVQSDGPGQGATFTLELPLAPKTNSN